MTITRRRARRINGISTDSKVWRALTHGMKYFSFGVNYNNEPDVYEYFFRAKDEHEVSEATGVDPEYISPCSMDDIRAAIRHGKHIDTVINVRLVEAK